MIDKWSTTIYYSKVDIDLIDRLCQELLVNLNENLERTPRTHPITFDNSNIYDMDSPVIREFKDVVEKTFEEYLGKPLNNVEHYYKSWVAKYSFGRGMPSHNHPDSDYSAVFYLIADTNDDGGEIVFTNPNDSEDVIIVKPVTGDVVVFPSNIYHQVQEFNNYIRLALPVDLFLK